MIEPMSEMLLLGTTIDYVREDYSKIYLRVDLYLLLKRFATACGCGISFHQNKKSYLLSSFFIFSFFSF